MRISHLAIVTLEALASGFVSALVGFGAGITAIAVWLYVVSPPVAASLVVVCSVVVQLQSLPWIGRSIEARRVLPFIVPALLGTALLAHLDTWLLKVAIALLLPVISLHMLLRGSHRGSEWGGRIAELASMPT